MGFLYNEEKRNKGGITVKVYDLQNEKGNICALILVESREIEQQENCGEDEALTRAVTNAILSLADSTGQKFMFTRILSYDEQDDGAVMVRFETAAAPEVKLGQYRGLEVSAAADAEAFAEKAVEKAAGNIEAEVPALIVERELDAILAEKKSEVLQDVHLNLLTDIYKILGEGIREVTSDYTKDDLWRQAIETVEIYFSEGVPQLSMDQMISSVANVLSLYGKITDSLCAKLAQIIEKRMDERERLTGESLAGQVFESYLKVSGFSVEQWLRQKQPEALERTRKNLTLDAVADAESLSVSDAELQARLERFAAQYELTVEQVRDMVGEEALRFDLRREKAKKLIADSAVCTG